MKLQSLITESGKSSGDVEQILRDLDTFRPNTVRVRSSQRQKARYDDKSKYAVVELREVGLWGPDEDSWGPSSHDYDPRRDAVPDRDDFKKVKKEFESWVKKQSWKKMVKSVDLDYSEKHWMQFYVRLK